MGRLGYDPDNIDTTKGGGKPVPPGRYAFIVLQAEEKDFSQGRSRGLRIVMEVATASRDVKVYENLIYVKNSQWRLKQFLEATGFDYDDPPDVDEIYDAQGVADFKLGRKKEGGKQYLEVDMFLEQGKEATGASEKGSAGAGSQPPLPSRSRGRTSKSSGGGRGRSRSRSRQRDDDQPPGDGGKRGTMIGGGQQEEPDDRKDREKVEDGLEEDELPF